MKTKFALVTLCFALISLASFGQSKIKSSREFGVYKTYEDYIHDKITDVGNVQECSQFNSYYNYQVSFEKETVDPVTTKYWGCEIPLFKTKHSFKLCYTPVIQSIQRGRYWNGALYSIMSGITVEKSTDSILLYYRCNGNDAMGHLGIYYDKNGNVTDYSASTNYMYASKGAGGLIEIADKQSARSFFNDDPELQKEYDTHDVTVKGKISSRLQAVLTFAQYAVKYNLRHPLSKSK
ncbi:MAG: hypothetical protein JWO03_2994 [Bacteroidetes bacterium]|nr:hypothetical protein [Bacteroidota bacterium]